MNNWQLAQPVSAVIFDCDGTLSTIEGIDYLAEQNGQGDEVKALTEMAMAKTGLTPELYQQRLALARPSEAQVRNLAQVYFDLRVRDIKEVIHCLQQQQKSVYFVSGGLYPAVAGFAELLQVPVENVFAVQITFDAQGKFSGFDVNSPMVTNDGKRKIVQQLARQHARMAYMGDGMNDLAVQDVVTRFVGYGGSFYREQIAARCDFYIRCASCAPLLSLVLTAQEQAADASNTLLEKAMQSIQQGDVKLPLFP